MQVVGAVWMLEGDDMRFASVILVIMFGFALGVVSGHSPSGSGPELQPPGSSGLVLGLDVADVIPEASSLSNGYLLILDPGTPEACGTDLPILVHAMNSGAIDLRVVLVRPPEPRERRGLLARRIRAAAALDEVPPWFTGPVLMRIAGGTLSGIWHVWKVSRTQLKVGSPGLSWFSSPDASGQPVRGHRGAP